MLFLNKLKINFLKKLVKEITYKLIKKLYAFLCKLYQISTTIYENNLLRISSPKSSFNKRASFKIKLNDSINFENEEKSKLVIINQFLNIRILNPKQVDLLIKQIFTKTIRKKISEITGFNFSIDFVIFYERKYIPINKRDVPTLKQSYSYRWHFDKPNSSNMLKIFIPIDINNESGPLEIISKFDSSIIKDFKEINDSKKRYFLTGKGDNLYGFYPTLCCHRDGIPKEKVSANQIMFQLNPNKDWVINSRVFKEYPKINNRIGIWTTEPKFPHISYLFNRRIYF